MNGVVFQTSTMMTAAMAVSGEAVHAIRLGDHAQAHQQCR